MAEAAASDLVFTKTTSDSGGLIEMPIAFDAMSVQTLVNAIREYEAEVLNLDTAVGIVGATGILEAVGKVEYPLIAGKFTGITATLINDWRWQAEARAGPSWVEVIIFGGSIFALNSFANNPVAPTAFVQVQLQQTEAPPQLGIEAEIAGISTEEFIALKDT